MIAHFLNTICWDATSSNRQDKTTCLLEDYFSASYLPTATFTASSILAICTPALGIDTGESIGRFMMGHSEAALAEIWNDTEEDVWDDY